DTEGPLSHADPNSKFSHMKEESAGRGPCAGGPSGAPGTTDTSGAWSGSDSKDGTGGHWEPGSDVPRSGCARLLTETAPRADPDRPHLCGTCGKSFRHLRSLLAHKKLRGGARARHGCAECGRTFCLRGDLLRHRDAHRARAPGPRRAGPAEERPFVCERCGSAFSWRESLQLHLREHRAPE
ncbi:ZN792 protein, partial [Catharus fuscescens]|nr:ZN792 protein [Catharus fuscescens]